MKARNSGFTLIELLVVIAIISLLSSSILTSISDIRNDAKISESLAEFQQLETTLTQYSIDVGSYPPECRTISTPCTKSEDPLLNPKGESGWDGPYGEMYNREHGWGGHIGFDRNYSGVFSIVYDDDPPGGINDNSGAIPPDAIHALDEQIDNGDGLKSGRVQACIWSISTGAQSAILFPSDPTGSFSYKDSDCLDQIPDS